MQKCDLKQLSIVITLHNLAYEENTRATTISMHRRSSRNIDKQNVVECLINSSGVDFYISTN